MNFLNKLTLSAAVLLHSALSVRAQNPILQDFHADPSARVSNGRLYVYPSHDAPGARNWKGMVDWLMFSTADVLQWTHK